MRVVFEDVFNPLGIGNADSRRLFRPIFRAIFALFSLIARGDV